MAPEIAVVVASHDGRCACGGCSKRRGVGAAGDARAGVGPATPAACRPRAEHFSRDHSVDRYRSLYQEVQAGG